MLRRFKTALRFVCASHSPTGMVEGRRRHFGMIRGTSAADGVFMLWDVENKALRDHERRVEERQASGLISIVYGEEHPQSTMAP